MDSLGPRLTDPSVIGGVAQSARSHQTMEHVSTVSHSTIAIGRSSSSCLTPPKELCFGSFSETGNNSSHQLLAEGGLPRGLRLTSENDNSLSSYRCSQPSPPLRLSIASKRVEDVKMNRIDKSRSGRRRRPCRRPFVFKSSPLAEGNGAGRFTSFDTNPFHSSKYSNLALRQPTDGSLSKPPQAALDCARSPVHLSRFMGASTSSLKLVNHDLLDAPLMCPSSNTSSENFPLLSTWSKQPQISRLRNAKAPKSQAFSTQNSNDYQSWEITLPKCSLPMFGTTFMS